MVNPPFTKSVTANVGQKFLRFVDRHFPMKSVIAENLQQEHARSELQLHAKYVNLE